MQSSQNIQINDPSIQHEQLIQKTHIITEEELYQKEYDIEKNEQLSCWMRCKLVMRKIGNRWIDFFEFDRLYNGQGQPQVNINKCFKRYHQNFDEEYQDKKLRFAYSYEYVQEQHKKEAIRKHISFSKQLYRFICCIQADETRFLEQSYIDGQAYNKLLLQKKIKQAQESHYLVAEGKKAEKMLTVDGIKSTNQLQSNNGGKANQQKKQVAGLMKQIDEDIYSYLMNESELNDKKGGQQIEKSTKIISINPYRDELQQRQQDDGRQKKQNNIFEQSQSHNHIHNQLQNPLEQYNDFIDHQPQFENQNYNTLQIVNNSSHNNSNSNSHSHHKNILKTVKLTSSQSRLAKDSSKKTRLSRQNDFKTLEKLNKNDGLYGGDVFMDEEGLYAQIQDMARNEVQKNDFEYVQADEMHQADNAKIATGQARDAKGRELRLAQQDITQQQMEQKSKALSSKNTKSQEELRHYVFKESAQPKESIKQQLKSNSHNNNGNKQKHGHLQYQHENIEQFDYVMQEQHSQPIFKKLSKKRKNRHDNTQPIPEPHHQSQTNTKNSTNAASTEKHGLTQQSGVEMGDHAELNLVAVKKRRNKKKIHNMLQMQNDEMIIENLMVEQTIEEEVVDGYTQSLGVAAAKKRRRVHKMRQGVEQILEHTIEL